MRRLALLALVLGGCFSTEEDAGPHRCSGLARTEQVCVYQGTFAPGLECAKLEAIRFDDVVLTPSEVTIRCGATDSDAVITIHKPADVDCGWHWAEGCVK